MLDYLIAVGAIVGIMVVWAIVLRAAKRRPNNGNEMSEDTPPNVFG